MKATTLQTKASRQLPSDPVKSATVVGLGNIGAELSVLLGRMQNLETVKLVDFDLYASGNIRAQNILPRDVGKPKVQVQARKLRQIAPGLQVRAFDARLEELSLSELRSDCLVSCLDSRIARMHLSECAFRLGVPLLDGAVQGSALQARVAVYLPGPESPCLECQFSDDDYGAIEQVAACTGAVQTASTNAPAALGAIVAGMQALELQKMVEGNWQQVLVDHQVFIDYRHHKHFKIRLCRNPNCRFDHQTWNIEPMTAEMRPRTMADLFELARLAAVGGPGGEHSQRLRVRRQQFVRRLICRSCRKMEQELMLTRRFAAAPPTCEECGGAMLASGFDTTEWLERATLRPEDLRRRLRPLGFRAGDILTIRSGDSESHFELDGTGARTNGRAVVQSV